MKSSRLLLLLIPAFVLLLIYVYSTRSTVAGPPPVIKDSSDVNDPPSRATDPPSHCSAPNVVFMMADDLGYGDLGYNSGKAKTPHLDAMSKSPNSIRLERHYSGGSVCSPTRGTVLTGRNHNRYCMWTANICKGVCDDFVFPEDMPVPLTEKTVGKMLSDAGYITALFGKWHTGDFKPVNGCESKWPVSHPGMHGFQHWWATERSAPSANINCACFDKKLCIKGHYVNRGAPPCTNYHTVKNGDLLSWPEPEIGDDAHFVVDRFEEFLDSSEVRDSNKPFFAYLPFHNVHCRFLAVGKYKEMYTNAGYNMDEIDYYGSLSAMDDAVGRVRQLLKDHGLSGKTMLWFTSDNGPERETPGSAGLLRGLKRDLYEGGIRVPGIIEWPKCITTNRVSNYPVVTSDLMPTMCDVLDIKCPTDRPMDGRSIMPLIRGTSDRRNHSIQWMYHVVDGNFDGEYNAAISGDQYKVFATYKEGKIASAQMYDLVNDISEKTDISHELPDMFEEMKKELENWRQSVIKSATQEVKCTKQYL